MDNIQFERAKRLFFLPKAQNICVKSRLLKRKKNQGNILKVSSLRLPTKAQNICVKYTIIAKTRKPKMRLATLEGTQ